MEENKNGWNAKLDLDDLAAVGGGTSVGEIMKQGSTPGSASQHAPSMGAGAGNGIPGLQTVPSAVLPGDDADKDAIEAVCPVCGIMTPHRLFSGARAKCTVCGNMLDRV